MTAKTNGRPPVRWTTAQIIEVQRQVLIANGKDPSVVPDEPFRFLQLREVKSRVGLGTTSIYKAMAAGKFPRPVRLDGLTVAASAAA
jgi:predicted DNA-binding transcriptional regulator AlpA